MGRIHGMDGGQTGLEGIVETYDASGKGGNGPTGFGKEAVGDLKSDEKGTGARFNAGKEAVELIPVWIIYNWAYDTYGQNATDAQLEALELLAVLADWQRDATSGNILLNAFNGDWITDCAAVFDYGRKKYAAWNWAKGMQWSVPTGCAVRHLLAILRGEENDVGEKGSGLPHRGHVACNFVMLAQYEETFKEGDDRPTKWLATSKAPDDRQLLLEKTTTIDLNLANNTTPEDRQVLLKKVDIGNMSDEKAKETIDRMRNSVKFSSEGFDKVGTSEDFLAPGKIG
jgi:hypothetical protein